VVKVLKRNNSATEIWGCSSAGRATALQAEGQGFDPPLLHQVSIGDWCSGSTPDFDSDSISSILISPAKQHGPHLLPTGIA
jgi:hypothetical protein